LVACASSRAQDLALLVQQFYDPRQRDRVKEIGTAERYAVPPTVPTSPDA